MPYVERPPPPDLASAVECFWRLEGTGRPHRVLPDGCIDILLSCDAGVEQGEAAPSEERAVEARVVGTMTSAIVVAPPPGAIAIGARFRPGEAARFIPEADASFTDTAVMLSDLWGAAGRDLDGAFAVGGRWADELVGLLRRRLALKGRAVDLRVRAAVAHLSAGESVRFTAAEVGLSERQLARRFTARVGIAPKVFARVARLRRAAANLASGASLTEAGAAAGYADQAHFTREARDLAGTTPRRLASELATAS